MKNRLTAAAFIGMAVILLLGAAIAQHSWAAGSGTGSRFTQTQTLSSAQKLQAADQQLEALLELGIANTAGSFDMIVKWQGEWQTALFMQQAANRLAKDLGLNAPSKEQVQDHNVYAADGAINGIVAKLSVMETEQGLYLVLLLSGTNEKAADMKAAQHLAGEKLLNVGAGADWNGAVQGFAPVGAVETGSVSQTAAGSQGKQGQEQGQEAPSSANMTLSALETSAANQGLQLSKLDAYEDGTTVSRTYAISSFSITALVPGKGLSGLQIGVHTDTETGRQQISFGSPMLTIEY